MVLLAKNIRFEACLHLFGYNDEAIIERSIKLNHLYINGDYCE